LSTDRKIFKGFAGGIGLTLVTIGISFFQLRLLLRFLPQSTVGIWLLYTSMGAYILLLDLGLTPTLGREISYAAGRRDIDEAERTTRIATLVRSCTRVASLVSVAAYLVAAVAGWAYLKTVTPPGLHGPLHLAWLLFSAGAVFNLAGEGWFAGIYGMGEVATEKAIRSLGAIVGFMLMLVTLLCGGGIQWLAASWLAQTVITVCAARIVLGRLNPAISTVGQVDYGLIRRMAMPALKYSLTLLGGMLILQTDNLVIASTLGTGIIPSYQAVAKLVTTLMTLSMTLVVVASPFMSQAHAQKDPAEIRRLLERNQRFSLSVLIVLGVCFACFADRVIHLWLGPGHFIGFGVVWVLLAIMCLEAHHSAMAAATMSTGRMVFVAPALIAGALNLVFSISLAHRLGALGIALGTLLAQLITNNWYVPFYAMRQFHITLRHQLRRVILPMLGLMSATAVTAVASRFLTRSLPDTPVLLTGCLATLAVGSAIVFFRIMSDEERQGIVRKLGRVGRGMEVAP
jgi:O-antigen/teichoic acid export membrane protein